MEKFVNNPKDAERFGTFCRQLAEFTQDLAKDRVAQEKAMKQMAAQQLKAEKAFKERVAKDRAKFAAQRAELEQELCELTEINEKLIAQRKELEKEQDAAYEELMAELDRNEADLADKECGDNFESLIDAFNKLSYESVLRNNVDELKIEKKQLQVAITEQKAKIAEMIPALEPTHGVTYKERNVLRVSLLHQVNKVRSEYQTSRLQEEALKAKLSN
ncbi:hypothetical protein B9Z55_000656 [Caenorhabditis nigoni]|uniref:Uncharacterized protein n=1 Tax=Caenorhabditis nigoni TaxID=1611254 RepID=A0A2G5VUJ6_9PELO|nr:hypothetical protein B9Z55_000656 [Caenorhabditis nigoni]